MRVLINGLSAVKPRTGVGHTTANLHRALSAFRPDGSFWLAPGEWLGDVASRMFRSDSSHSPRPNSHTLRNLVKSMAKEVAKGAYRSHLQTAARWGGFDLYHEPNFIAVRTPLPTVLTVHDLSVLLHPEWHPADRVRFHERHFVRGLADIAHVIVVSESVRRDAIDHLGLKPERVTSVYNGIDECFQPQSKERVEALRNKWNLPERYSLATGTIEPRKNIGTVMKAFCDLPSELRSRCPLVLAGGWGWKSQAEREYFESVARPRGAIHLGYVSAEDLPALYSGAAALLYPSHYEGFGLPPVEMLACGGAVVASKAAALREVLGNHAHFVDALDRDGWREAMKRMICEVEFAQELKQGGIEHARSFTWQRAAERTFGVYERVLGETVSRAA